MRFKLKVPGCCIKAIEYTVRGVKVVVESQALDGICPICGTRSGRVHSYYERQLLDLPLGEMAVRLRVRVRRFRCLRETCQRCTFAESIPKLTERYARHTKRLSDIIWHVGQVAGGRPGSRLAQRLQIPVSRHCMLRLLRRLDIPKIDAVRVLGVDDWAKRRGQTYGTILVDLETRRVIDLLPDREANTLASWLEQHPSVEIVTRDRSTEYANGIAAGAPQAKQVADRWHLLKNLTEMTQRVLRDEWYRVQTEQPTQEIRPHPLPRAAGDIRQKILNREKRLKRYQLVQYFKHKGYSQRRIARVLGLSRGLVRTLYNATAFPERKTVSRSSQLDPYLAYLNTQMKTRKVTARQLWHELVEQGYPGSYSQVSKWVTGFNQQRARSTQDLVTGSLPGRDTCLRLLTTNPEVLTDDDHYWLDVLTRFPLLQQLYTLIQDFADMIRQRNPSRFDVWLRACQASEFRACQRFAHSLSQDYDAVRAALSTDWSNGQTEGQVHRLKLLKRQMYGRANLDLLRIRVCYLP